MLTASKPLKDEPDKFVNGYIVDDLEEDKKSVEELLQEEEESMDELEKLLEEYKKSVDELSDLIEETKEELDDELEELEDRLEGSGTDDRKMRKPEAWDPKILDSFYKVIQYYIEKETNLQKKITKIQNQGNKARTAFHDFNKSANQLFYSPIGIKPENKIAIANYRKDAEKKFNESQELYDEANELENFGLVKYYNLITKLVTKYNNLREKTKSLPETYKEQTNINKQIYDVLDFLEIFDTSKLNEISPEGNDARDMYYKLIQTKRFPDKKDSHETMIKMDPIKRESATRNEILFKKHVLNNKYDKDKPLVGFNQNTFYDKIDFVTDSRLIELKSSVQKKDKDSALYIAKGKIDELLRRAKTDTKKPQVYWYLEPKRGYLASLSKEELDNISSDDYFGTLYTLKDKLDENTFTDNDIDPDKTDEVTYKLEYTDNRVTPLKDYKKKEKKKVKEIEL
jgi:hypothetical protein